MNWIQLLQFGIWSLFWSTKSLFGSISILIIKIYKLQKYFMCITFWRIIEHGIFTEVRYPNSQSVSKFQLCYYIVSNRPYANYIIYDHMSKCQRNFIWFCKQKSHCKDFFSAFTQKSLLVLRYRCWGSVNFFCINQKLRFHCVIPYHENPLINIQLPKTNFFSNT